MAGPANIRTEVAFTATEKNQPSISGTYTRTRGATGALREDLALGDFRAARIEQPDTMATQGPWTDPPYPARALMNFVPYTPIRFDATDVIQSIEPGQVGSQHATCIHFVTVRGEDRNPGEICVSDADSTILAWHDSRKSWQATRYTRINGGLEPSEFTYREGDALSLTATLTFTLLDAEPVEATTIPSNWDHAIYCSTFQPPIASFAPQPPAPGSSGLPIINVGIHLHVTAEGTIGSAEILQPVRPDLDAEALQLVRTWRYQPARCNGVAQAVPVDVRMHFQGR